MELWTDLGFEWKFTWCGVGSHQGVPDDIQELQVWIGHCLALIGGVCCTGDAPQSDTNFYDGYMEGRKRSGYNLPPGQVYYTRLKNQKNSHHSPRNGFHELECYPESQVIAQDLAYEARGSFQGLFPSGIALQTRNVFQVLSEDLQHPRKFTVLWAPYKTKNGSQLQGGTNTAYQLSRKNKIPVVNLWVQTERHKFIDWLVKQLNDRKIPLPDLGVSHGSAETTPPGQPVPVDGAESPAEENPDGEGRGDHPGEGDDRNQ
jgi:hypothetical protein